MSRQKIWGPVFLAPALILLLSFYIIPFSYAIRLSFYDVGLTKDVWIGLGNYRALLKESGFWDAIRVTGKFAVVHVFFSMVVAYGLGLALSKFGSRFRGSVLTLYRIPVIFTGIATIVVWRWFFRFPDGGLNNLSTLLGVPAVSWLGNPVTAAWAIGLVLAGSITSGAMLLYVIAISQIDKEMIEAAKIDGASEFQLIRYIITPLTQRVRLYLLLVYIIAALNIWEHPFFLTSGGPLGSTTTIMYKIYDKALIEGNLGMGSALTTLVTLVILLLAYVLIRCLREFLG